MTQCAFGLLARAFAACVVLLLSASSVVSAFHYVAVAHALCQEHGVLEHTEGRKGPGLRPESAHSEGQPSWDADLAFEHEHGHDVCAVRALSELGVNVGRVNAAESPRLEFCLAHRLEPGANAKHSIALLASAPKLAPPA